MSEVLEHFIDGRRVASTGKRQGDIYNPASGKFQKAVGLANQADLEGAIAAARDAFPKWAQTSPLRRARILNKFRDLIEANAAELASLITNEHG
jgi:malonate-semialdehyde dehydrogenase (acetylating)/methylmalonate-semialdehyde dehydrogenase